MVRIRFRRVGLKKQPSYRIVVTDKRNARDGKFIEIIGHHNPRTQPSTDVIDDARALYWLSVGAQPSEAVRRLMVRTGTWERYERLRQGEPMEKLVEEAETAQAAAEPVSPRTRFPAPAPGQGTITGEAPAAVAEAVAEEEAVEEAEEEAEAAAEVEEEVEEEIRAEVEETAEAEEEVEEETKAEAEETETEPEAAEEEDEEEEAEADEDNEEEDETE